MAEKPDANKASISLQITGGLLLSLCLNLLTACGGGSSNSNSNSNNNNPPSLDNYSYSMPVATNDGWPVADLNQYQIDPAGVENLVDKVANNTMGYRHVDALAIAYKGELIFDQRFRTQLDFADGWANNQDIELHILNSVTKSITSALIGIAIDRGDIAGVNTPVHDYFAHKQPIANWNSDKESITIENWLNMRSGYLWDEWNVNYLDPTNLNSQMNNAADPIQFLLDRPMATAPGSTFAYSTGISFGLGRILQLATGQSYANFLQTYLLEPLSISKHDYWSLDGQLHSGSALYLTSRAMLKFGQLFLDGGVWQGTRIISQQWVEESTQPQFSVGTNGLQGYGYHWWMNKFNVAGQTYDSYYANGYGGQFIFIFPELDLVVVFNGRAFEDGQASELSYRIMLETDILPGFIAAQKP